MRWFSNLKIATKLRLGFGIVIVLTCILGVLSVYLLRSVDVHYTSLNEGVQTALTLSQESGRAFSRVRRNALSMAYNAKNISAVKTSYEDFNSQIKISIDALENIKSYISTDKMISDNDKTAVVSSVQEIIDGIDISYRAIGNNLMEAINDGRYDEVDKIVKQGSAPSENTNKLLDEFIQQTTNEAKNLSDQASKDAKTDSIMLISISFITIITSILLATFMGNIIKKPILALSDAAKKITSGDLDINICLNTTDEIGDLSRDIDHIIDIFKTLLKEINLTSSKLESGDIDSRIEEEKFVGDYKKVTVAINKTYSDLISDTIQLINGIRSYAEGDFEPTSRRMPGKKAVFHENMDLLQSNLKDINKEIRGLVQSASCGNFDNLIDSKKYKGDWQIMSDSLNNLIKAVETPILEVASVLEEVSNANFETSISGDYKGQFKVMKDAVNKTVTNTSSYIKDISIILNKMSNQDLNIKIDKPYIGDFKEIKDALEEIITTFNTLIFDFKGSSDQVASGSKQISESTMALAIGATSQASAVEELYATVITISEQISENTSNAKNANELATASKSDGVVGKEEMEKMLLSMEEIEEASLQISKIIKTIEDISFQTNLLALNAAVEAARAGQHGKGFAVVAEEVRNLAARSQNATVETSELINKTVRIISNGTKTANSTAEALNEMVNKITHIAQLIDNVSSASIEQELAISQINKGIQQISEITQANTATSEETAASTEELSSQAEVFRNSISKFKLRFN